MSDEPLSIYRLSGDLEIVHIRTAIVPGRIVLAGYASPRCVGLHNWMFAVDVEHARAMHWGGRIHVVASVDDALRIMGVTG